MVAGRDLGARAGARFGTGSALRARLARPGAPGTALIALAVYVAATIGLFGAALLHGGNECVCSGADESIPTWGMAWFPYAIAHGLNPFYSHIIYVPKGFDVALATVAPGAALMLTPVTLTAGPLAAYNLAITLSPALAAFFAFLLCRRLTGRFAPALVGGWLFGFSDYELGQMTTHLHMALVFLLPALVHLVLRRLDDELSRRWFVVLMGLALLLQFSFATETFASVTLFGAVTLVVAYVLAEPAVRARLRSLAPELLLAYVLMAVLAAPYIYYALQPGGLPVVPSRDDYFSNALLSFFVPPVLMQVGGSAYASTTRMFSAGPVEGGAYLGLPLLALALAAAVVGRRRLSTRVAAIAALITGICSLGGYLQLRRNTGIPLPWWPATHLPLLGLMIPARFVVYTALAASVLAAQALAADRVRPSARAVSWALAALSVAALWPAVGGGFWRERKPLPALFTQARYRHVIGAHDIALIVPVGPRGYSMLWQAQAGLRFAMASGYLPPPESPNPYKRDPIYPTLSLGRPVPDEQVAAQRFLRAQRVTVAVVDMQIPAARPWLGILERLGWRGRSVGGAIVLRPGSSSLRAALTPVRRVAAWRGRSPRRSRTRV